MNTLICNVLQLYVYALFGRVILSWFPISPGGAMASIYRILHMLTEPVLGPIRRMLPPLGAFDLSPLVVILIVAVLQSRVC